MAKNRSTDFDLGGLTDLANARSAFNAHVPNKTEPSTPVIVPAQAEEAPSTSESHPTQEPEAKDAKRVGRPRKAIPPKTITLRMPGDIYAALFKEANKQSAAIGKQLSVQTIIVDMLKAGLEGKK